MTANLPEWPAAEVLLTHLGRLFAVTFSNPKLDMTLRSTSLDYLAQIATHLRKSHMKIEDLEEKENLKSIIGKVYFCCFIYCPRSSHLFLGIFKGTFLGNN